MKTEITEIADRIYRLSTFLPQVGPNGFTFNQFLIDADEPLLFHYGHRALFPLVSDAVKSVIPLDRLRWTTCSHVEADESGAMNDGWPPRPTPRRRTASRLHIWVTDMANRAPRALKNDEAIDLGGKKVRWLDTPHVPHNWDAGLIYEETTGTLFSSDLFTQFGACRGDDDGRHRRCRDRDREGHALHAGTPLAEPTLRRLAALKPKTIALMHGPASRATAAPRSTRWPITTPASGTDIHVPLPR